MAGLTLLRSTCMLTAHIRLSPKPAPSQHSPGKTLQTTDARVGPDNNCWLSHQELLNFLFFMAVHVKTSNNTAPRWPGGFRQRLCKQTRGLTA